MKEIDVQTLPRRREVPFFKPDLRQEELDEVAAVLRSGWLTTGPRVRQFERDICDAVGAEHAVALNSCTAALHLAVEALGLQAGQGVLVPTMTFAATAEVVRYLGGVPLLVDCDPITGNLDLESAAAVLEQWTRRGTGPAVGIMPVHVGGLMLDIGAIRRFAEAHGLWIVEDAAHALPAAWRPDASAAWERCGENTAAVTCFSFYANKTITTGEGGMAVTRDERLASRMRLMSLHGLSHDAWNRYASNGSWDYRIVAPGYKYNLTDLAAAIGIHQLRRAEAMRVARERAAACYRAKLVRLDAVEPPPLVADRVHSWHLFPVRLNLDRVEGDRNQVYQRLKARGITCAVHWRPLHLHPYYQETFALDADAYPNATHLFERTLSLPLYPTLAEDEIDYVVESLADAVAGGGASRLDG